MPTRRFHFTGRQRISRSDVTVRIHNDNALPQFQVESLQLDKYLLPADARVFVEAYLQTVCQRYFLGPAASYKVGALHLLNEFNSTDGVLFRIKVTSLSAPKGVLLAVADRISPVQEEGPTRSFLSVVPEELREEMFRVQWDEGDDPVLLVNRRIGKEHVLGAEFMALALPAVIREILTRFLIIERRDNDDNDEEHASSRQWFQFGARMAGRNPPTVRDGGRDVQFDWIDEAVSGFCEKRNVAARFARQLDINDPSE